MIAGLLLAGGAGQRMGGVDKGLCPLAGTALAEHVVRRLAPQVGPVLISANRNAARYAAWGQVVADLPAFAGLGPLAGIASCSQILPPEVSALAVVPCDTPCLPPDTVARLAQALHGGAAAAYAQSPAGPQYAVLLLRRPALASIPAYLQQGGRALRHWLAAQGALAVPFDNEAAFANANDAAALAALEAAWHLGAPN